MVTSCFLRSVTNNYVFFLSLNEALYICVLGPMNVIFLRRTNCFYSSFSFQRHTCIILPCFLERKVSQRNKFRTITKIHRRSCVFYAYIFLLYVQLYICQSNDIYIYIIG